MSLDDTAQRSLHLAAAERRLVGELATGATVSAAAAAAALVIGGRGDRGQVTRFGRQTLAWVGVELLIAAVGAAGAERSGAARSEVRGGSPDDAATRRARRLHAVLAVNTGLDAGYVAGGAAATRQGRTGDGLAVVVQGLFLLWLDSRHLRRFGRLLQR